MQGAQLDADGGALISQTSKVHDAAQQQEVLRAARQLTQARLACQQGLHAQILGCEPSAAHRGLLSVRAHCRPTSPHLPLVSFPLLAMLRTPRSPCSSRESTSSLKVGP